VDASIFTILMSPSGNPFCAGAVEEEKSLLLPLLLLLLVVVLVLGEGRDFVTVNAQVDVSTRHKEQIVDSFIFAV